MAKDKYEINCSFCGNKIEIDKTELDGLDFYVVECSNCNCDDTVEIEYDEDDNIVDLHV